MRAFFRNLTLTITLLFGWVSPTVVGESGRAHGHVEKHAPREDYSQGLYSLIKTTEFSVNFSKRVVVPGLTKTYDTRDVPAMCIVTASAEPKEHIIADPFVLTAACPADKNGVCENLLTCAKSKEERFLRNVLPISSTATSANNKYGDHCWQAAGKPGRRSTFAFKYEGEKEELCTFTYKCTLLPEPQLAMCRPRNETCPQLNDCINRDLSLEEKTARELAEASNYDEAEYFRRFKSELRHRYKEGQARLSTVDSSNRHETTDTRSTP